MIAVDTSALMAVILDESTRPACVAILAENAEILMSAMIMAEAQIVANRRGVGHLMRSAIGGLPITVVPATSATAARVTNIYSRWGKGVSPAKLNIMDCFAYDVAAEHSCPLLFIGNDFAQTDIRSALAS